MTRPCFNKDNKLSEIARVDQAGEYGAVRIYSGQIAASSKVDNDHNTLQEMLEHEEEHLQYFNQQITDNQYRPTILRPLWHVGGYLMGYITRKVNSQTAMLCTQAVEEVIEQHYAEQIEELEVLGEPILQKKIKKFREDELEHRDIAIQHDSRSAPAHFFVYHSIQSICRIAIGLSKRF